MPEPQQPAPPAKPPAPEPGKSPTPPSAAKPQAPASPAPAKPGPAAPMKTPTAPAPHSAAAPVQSPPPAAQEQEPEDDAPLTARQQAFVREYLIDQNATAAYKRAGYKDTPAAQQNASRLMLNDKVAAAIDEGLAKLADAKGLVAERIWDEWRCIALSDMGDIIDFSGPDPRLRPANEIPERARRAIASVKVKRYLEGDGDSARVVEILEFKLWDKPGVLRDAAKAREMFKDKLEISGAVDIVGIEVISQPRRSAPKDGDR